MHTRKLSPEKKVALVEEYERGEGGYKAIAKAAGISSQLFVLEAVIMTSMDQKCSLGNITRDTLPNSRNLLSRITLPAQAVITITVERIIL